MRDLAKLFRRIGASVLGISLIVFVFAGAMGVAADRASRRHPVPDEDAMGGCDTSKPAPERKAVDAMLEQYRSRDIESTLRAAKLFGLASAAGVAGGAAPFFGAGRRRSDE